MKKIIMTGGGTAGHVIPNIALMPALKELGYTVYYIGSYNGIERELIEGIGIPYFGIDTGKLRRYFDLKNFIDPFRIIHGFAEAGSIIKKIKPDVIFSKGGYVSVPVVRAAHMQKIPVILHESDITIGLANKLCIGAADRICCSFPETMEYLPKNKAVLTGSPIRAELLCGSRDRAFEITGLSTKKPILLVTGGSLGSQNINDFIRSILDRLLKCFYVIHLCGKGKLAPALNNLEGYLQYEYVSEELPDIMAAADIVVSRAGAGTISELAALAKPQLLIPLSRNASRGDQILNARSYERLGYSMVMEEEGITSELLYESIMSLYSDRQKYIDNMKASRMNDANSAIVRLIDSYCDAKDF